MRLEMSVAAVFVAACGGVACGQFELRIAGLANDLSFRPSAGVFHNPGPYAAVSTGLLGVRGDFAAWDPASDLPLIQDATFFAVDRGKPSNWAGESNPNLNGQRNPAPEFSGGRLRATFSGALAPDGSVVQAPSFGFGIGPAFTQGLSSESAPSIINGREVDSMFFMRFVMPAGATIVGDNMSYQIFDPELGLLEDGLGIGSAIDLPWDGSFDAAVGLYRIEYERSPAGAFAPEGYERVDAYIVRVPVPGAAGLLAAAGLGVVRRRRR